MKANVAFDCAVKVLAMRANRFDAAPDELWAVFK